MRRSTVILICLVVAPLAAAATQEPSPPRSGDRVRVTATSPRGGPFVGALVVGSADSLLVRRARDTVRIPAASVQRIEVSSGTRSNAGTGALIGFLGGAGFGAALAAGGCDEFSDDVSVSTGTCWAGAMGGFGLAGTLVGLLAGALIRTDNWQVVPAGVHVGFIPSRDGAIALGLSLNF